MICISEKDRARAKAAMREFASTYRSKQLGATQVRPNQLHAAACCHPGSVHCDVRCRWEQSLVTFAPNSRNQPVVDFALVYRFEERHLRFFDNQVSLLEVEEARRIADAGAQDTE